MSLQIRAKQSCVMEMQTGEMSPLKPGEDKVHKYNDVANYKVLRKLG